VAAAVLLTVLVSAVPSVWRRLRRSVPAQRSR
jgi:hypothetical protein